MKLSMLGGLLIPSMLLLESFTSSPTCMYWSNNYSAGIHSYAACMTNLTSLSGDKAKITQQRVHPELWHRGHPTQPHLKKIVYSC